MINDWVIPRTGSTLFDLVNDINAAAGYTGINCFTTDVNLILSINPDLQTTGIGFLGA